MKWNLNSLTTGNFHRVDIIEAHVERKTRWGWPFFYKNSLLLTFVVTCPLRIDSRIKICPEEPFFTVLYRGPSFNYASTEFEAFLENFNNLYSKIKAENPFAMFFAGDFNCKSQLWWPEGEETPEGREIEDMVTSLALT